MKDRKTFQNFKKWFKPIEGRSLASYGKSSLFWLRSSPLSSKFVYYNTLDRTSKFCLRWTPLKKSFFKEDNVENLSWSDFLSFLLSENFSSSFDGDLWRYHFQPFGSSLEKISGASNLYLSSGLKLNVSIFMPLLLNYFRFFKSNKFNFNNFALKYLLEDSYKNKNFTFSPILYQTTFSPTFYLNDYSLDLWNQFYNEVYFLRKGDNDVFVSHYNSFWFDLSSDRSAQRIKYSLEDKYLSPLSLTLCDDQFLSTSFFLNNYDSQNYFILAQKYLEKKENFNFSQKFLIWLGKSFFKMEDLSSFTNDLLGHYLDKETYLWKKDLKNFMFSFLDYFKKESLYFMEFIKATPHLNFFQWKFFFSLWKKFFSKLLLLYPNNFSQGSQFFAKNSYNFSLFSYKSFPSDVPLAFHKFYRQNYLSFMDNSLSEQWGSFVHESLGRKYSYVSYYQRLNNVDNLSYAPVVQGSAFLRQRMYLNKNYIKTYNKLRAFSAGGLQELDYLKGHASLPKNQKGHGFFPFLDNPISAWFNKEWKNNYVKFLLLGFLRNVKIFYGFSCYWMLSSSSSVNRQINYFIYELKHTFIHLCSSFLALDGLFNKLVRSSYTRPQYRFLLSLINHDRFLLWEDGKEVARQKSYRKYKRLKKFLMKRHKKRLSPFFFKYKKPFYKIKWAPYKIFKSFGFTRFGHFEDLRKKWGWFHINPYETKNVSYWDDLSLLKQFSQESELGSFWNYGISSSVVKKRFHKIVKLYQFPVFLEIISWKSNHWKKWCKFVYEDSFLGLKGAHFVFKSLRHTSYESFLVFLIEQTQLRSYYLGYVDYKLKYKKWKAFLSRAFYQKRKPVNKKYKRIGKKHYRFKLAMKIPRWLANFLYAKFPPLNNDYSLPFNTRSHVRNKIFNPAFDWYMGEVFQKGTFPFVSRKIVTKNKENNFSWQSLSLGEDSYPLLLDKSSFFFFYHKGVLFKKILSRDLKKPRWNWDKFIRLSYKYYVLGEFKRKTMEMHTYYIFFLLLKILMYLFVQIGQLAFRSMFFRSIILPPFKEEEKRLWKIKRRNFRHRRAKLILRKMKLRKKLKYKKAFFLGVNFSEEEEVLDLDKIFSN